MLMCLLSLTSSIDNVVKKISYSNSNKNAKKQNKTPTLSIKDVVDGNHTKKDIINSIRVLSPIFDNLKNVQNYFNHFNYQNKRVLVAFDINKKGSKNWCIFETLKILFNYIKSNPAYPLYEQINPDYHKIFFDVDVKHPEDIINFNFNVYKQKIENELNTILNNKLRFVWLNSTGITLSKKKKISYHLIIPNVSCSNYQNEQLMNYLNTKLGTKYLDYVYKDSQCFRMWNCSKFSENRPLKNLNKGTFNDTLINIYRENVEKINPKIQLKEEPKSVKSNVYSKDWISVPNNEYLMANFEPSKYQINVYSRSHCGTSLACL
jgi:hypothetical protein